MIALLTGVLGKYLVGGVVALAAFAAMFFKGRASADGKVQKDADAKVANAVQGQQVAQAQADAAQAQAAAAQAHTDAVTQRKDVDTSVTQMAPKDVKNELDNNWSR